MSDGPKDQPAHEEVPDHGDHGDHDRRLAILLAMLLLGLFATVGFTVQFLNVAFGIWFTEVFLFLGVTAVALRWSGRDPVRFPDADSPAPLLFGFGFGVGAVNLFAVGLPLQFVAQQLAPPGWKETFDAANLFKPQSPLELVVITAGVAIAAPLCEEYFFRGVLLQGLVRRSAVRGLVISAVVFSVFHLDPVGFVARVELGVVFGYLYLRTRSLWPGIAAHAANNSVSMAAFFFSQSEGEGPEAVDAETWRAIGLLVAIGVPLLYGLGRLGQAHGLLTPRARPAPELLEPRPLLKLAWPWAAAAVVAIALLFAVDRRGIALNLIDLQTQLSGLPEAKQAALRELRSRARRGELPVSEYEQARRAARASP